MEQRFWNARWNNNQAIVLQLIDNDLCPFDKQLAANQLLHQADFLEFITGRTIRYGGIVQHDEKEPGVIYSQYVPQEVVGEQVGDFWAWAHPRTEGSNIVGGVLNFGERKVNAPDRFAGIFLHELLHGFGLAHWNHRRSVMNNEPYQNYIYQGMLMLSDYIALGDLFPGPRPLLMPHAFDYGDISQGKCVIFIPSIEWRPGDIVSVYLRGSQESGEWILTADPSEIREEVYSGAPRAAVIDNKLVTLIRYMGNSFELKADLLEFSGPQSKVTFGNIDLRYVGS